jgi:uncharacterized protein YprB with RNaseH-like and TPR domain
MLKTPPPNKAKILLWDIESTSLKSAWGTMLCVGYKWYGEKRVYVPSVMDYPNWKRDMTTCDKRLVRDFVKVLGQADMIVTWYGKMFDWKYIIGKCFEYGIEYPEPVPHVDLCFTAKANFVVGGNSLKNVSEVGGFTRGAKTPVGRPEWRKAAVGHVPSIRYVIEHCRQDVVLLEEAYDRMRPLVRQHPRVRGWNPCRVCGSMALQLRGTALTTTKGPRVRVHCTNCGAWESRPENAVLRAD